MNNMLRFLALTLTASLAQVAAADLATLVSGEVVFSISTDTGAYTFLDRTGGITWASNPDDARFGEVECELDGKAARLPLRGCSAQAAERSLELTFRPVEGRPEAWLRVRFEADPAGRAFEIAYEAATELHVRSLRLLDQAFGVTDADAGGVVVPVREGLWIPANSAREFTHTFDTYAYEGCHMAMFGVVKRGTTLLVHWRDPYTALEIRSRFSSGAGADWGQRLTSSLVLRNSARRCRVAFPGPGDHVTIGLAYREAARAAGWWVPWSVKVSSQPVRAQLFGASNYKLWSVLDRQMNEESTREQRVTVNWTFDEAAQVAEHLKRDLALDKILFLMGGWIHRGYDNQHPDILPAAPECGGDAAFAECARRVLALGYVFGLHDNYQDIYRDSPSWNEDLIMKQRDGGLARGGVWAGGRAYLTCSKQAVELARRPQNLPAVRRLTGANAYFIDTTYAAGLQECFDPHHPLSRLDDLHWKQVLSDDAREQFGIFGSECGREWAIPHSDFFEGLTGVSGRHFHDTGLEEKVGGAVVPLFEIVYRDTIAMYGKYGYDLRRAASYVLDHALYGRPLHYHNVPPHLYWKQPQTQTADVTPSVGEFEAAGPHRILFSYRWEVRRVPARDWRVFVHFTTPSGEIAFQDDHTPPTPATQWNVGTMEFGTFRRELPDYLEGVYDVRMGLFDPVTQQRAELPGQDDGERRHVVGRLRITAGQVTFERLQAPTEPWSDAGVFGSGAGGWTGGLHPYDRFVKNTHEILSPLNELTAQVPMTGHAFLTADGRVQRSVFGSGAGTTTVTVNRGDGIWKMASPLGGEVELTPFGLLIEAPRFVAFHARAWGGQRYSAPVLFTLRSLDDQPLVNSTRVRVYHGFGGADLVLGGRRFSVPREAVVNPRSGNTESGAARPSP